MGMAVSYSSLVECPTDGPECSEDTEEQGNELPFR